MDFNHTEISPELRAAVLDLGARASLGSSADQLLGEMLLAVVAGAQTPLATVLNLEIRVFMARTGELRRAVEQVTIEAVSAAAALIGTAE